MSKRLDVRKRRAAGVRTNVTNSRESSKARKDEAEIQAAHRGGRPKHRGAEQVRETASTPSERLSKELEAVPPNQLLRINTSVKTSIVKVRGTVARLRALLPRITKALPDFDPRQLDDLELRAAALAKAESRHRLSRNAGKPPQGLLAEGLALRALLSADLHALVARRLISEKSVERLRGGNAYGHVARDLLFLTSLFHGKHKDIEGRCATTAEELRRAEAIAGQLNDWVRERHEPTPEAAAAALARARAFTLLSRAYAEVRRTVQYVRFHEGDANAIAPPLSGSRKRKYHESSDQAGTSDANTPPTKALRSQKPAAPNLEADAASEADPSPNGTRKPPAGFPGSDPFLH